MPATNAGNKHPTLVLYALLSIALVMFMVTAFLSFLVVTQQRAPFLIGEPNETISLTATGDSGRQDTRDRNVRVLPKDTSITPVSED